MRSILQLLRPPVSSQWPSVGLLILRCAVGFALAVHGYGKYLDVPAFAQEFFISIPLAYLATLTQLAAGMMMAIGLLTPFSATALAATMLVATAQLVGRGEVWINPHGHSYEASAFYLVANLMLLACGPGSYSLDALLTRTSIRK